MVTPIIRTFVFNGAIITYIDCYNTFKSEKYVYERLHVSLASGSRPFLEWLHAYLGSKLDISGGVFEKHKDRFTCWVLRYMKKDSIRLLKWMYYSPDVPCLARKRDKNDRALEFGPAPCQARCFKRSPSSR